MRKIPRTAKIGRGRRPINYIASKSRWTWRKSRWTWRTYGLVVCCNSCRCSLDGGLRSLA